MPTVRRLRGNTVPGTLSTGRFFFELDTQIVHAGFGATPIPLISAATVAAGYQPLDADLTTIAAAGEAAYAKLAGRSGGQSLIGGTASGDDLAISSTSHGTKGNINIGSDSTYDEVNGRLGIGTLTPAARLTVSDTSTASSRGGELYQIESSSTSCQLRLLKARGTEATPTAIQSGDVLGTFTFAGHNGTAFVNAANIRVYATENWDGTHRGVAMTIGTAPTGSNANTLHFQLDEFGMTLLAVGQGYKVKEGSNACMGAATLSGGTVTVSTTKVTTSSRIFLTIQSLGTVTVPKAIGVTARTASTSFTITSADATDTSVVAWEIKEPSP